MSLPEYGTTGQPSEAGAIPPAAPAPPEKPTHASAGRPPAPPAALASAPNVVALLRALRRRWLLASSLGLVLGAAAAAAVWFLLPPAKNTANVQLILNAEKDGFVYEHPERIGDNFEAFQSKQVHFLHSRMVLNAAMRQPGIAQLALFHNIQEPIEWLEREIRVDFPSREILRLTIAGEDLDELKTLANAVTKAYMAEIVEKQTKDRQTRLEELRKILARYKDKLTSSRRVKVELAKRSGGGADSRAAGMMSLFLQDQLKAARAQLVSVKDDLRHLEVKEGLATLRADQPVPQKMIASYLEREPEISTKMMAIAAAEQLYEETKKRAPKGAKDSDVRALKKIRDDIESEEILLASERSRLTPKLEAKIRENSLQQAEFTLADLKSNIERLKALEKTLEADIQKYIRAIEEGPSIAMTMTETEFDIEQTETEVKTLTTRIGELEIEMNDPPRVRVYQDAVAYKVDNFARKVQMSSAAGIALLGLCVFGIALLEFRSRRVSTVDEVTQGLGVRVVGTVPACPRRIRNGVGNGKMSYWKNMLAESVDAARTLLLHHARREDLRIIMVTSAVGGEGKTSLSSHLAVSMARSGRKTLLIDCDLRNPSAHKLFGVSLEPGLSSVLRGEMSVEDALHATQATGLWLMPAGACDAEALCMLARDGVQPVFDRLRTEFDFIVVDSSPVLPVADSLMVAQQVDGVLFAILREVSRLPKVHEAYQKLSTLGVRMLGAVVNGTSGAVYGNGGYTSNARYLTPTKE
jgi:succinoglycan biosynthesis transport protein ExoP